MQPIHFFRSLMIAAIGTTSSLMMVSPLLAAPTDTAVQIELSHQLDEERAARVEPLIERFNSQNKDVQVKLVRRVQGQPPKAINLVTNEEHSRFVANKAKFKALQEVMREAKAPLNAKDISPELRENVDDSKGNLFALPVAFSTPVLFINKAAFRKAGLNPEAPPKTWAELQRVAGVLVDAGSSCPYTTSWPAWVHIDNLSAWNGAEISDAKGKLNFNSLIQVKHIAMMATWSKSRYFIYFGRRDEADRRFAMGECAMLTSSSSLSAEFSDSRTLNVGISALPYHDDVRGAPKTTLADGASLWVAADLKPAETKAVAKFITYVMSPEMQIDLTVASGFLPVTPVARAAASSKLLNNDLLGLKVAQSQLREDGGAYNVRVSQIQPVRIIVEEEMENVWANKKPPKQALDDAVERGNLVMQPAMIGRRGK